MKITVIVGDGAVYIDKKCYSNLSWADTPENVHAMQWNGNAGWLEFNDGTPNEAISELPTWYANAEAAWNSADEAANAPSEPTIPTIVSMRQARLALLQAELLATVDAAIAAGSEADQITWEYATEVDRNSPLVVNLSASLGLTEQQLDDLFTLAATL